ncbi:MAG: coenzyme F420-0:L-glutamate ligase [Firmicutes bacterium]|nr:coenzyme F420-0:L-glutamate ligase [Bacillota bacterium]
MSSIGTIVRGIRTPIIEEGDDLVKVVADSLETAAKENNIKFDNDDVVCVTEAVLAITQGNFATLDDIAQDVRDKFGEGHVGLVHPTPVSRNRFLNILKGIAKGVKKLTVLISPIDEVGNSLLKNYNPFIKDDNLYTPEEFTKQYGKPSHLFTGLDYIEIYQKASSNIEVVISNNPGDILKYTKNVIAGTIHSRQMLKDYLIRKGAEKVVTICEILQKSVNSSGYNADYGLLGSNMAGINKVKLFPRDGEKFVYELQKELKKRFSVSPHVMIFGDGAFKDPVGGIWELADPVVSPGFTDGLKSASRPEAKLKNLVAQFENLSKKEREAKIKEVIATQSSMKIDDPNRLGTTPRQLPDLLGSLADLSVGSGSKGTPVVLVQDYFKGRYS